MISRFRPMFPALALAAAAALASCGGKDSDDADAAEDGDGPDGTGEDPGPADPAEDPAPDDGTAPDDDAADTPAEEAVEAPEPAVAITCTDDIEDVYVTPSDLPPFTEASRGEIVRCAREGTLTVDEIEGRLTAAGVTGVTPVTEVETVLVAYRTERMGSTPGVGTARVYIPAASRPGADPVVVSNHGTIGLADTCAPTVYGNVSDYLTLPFASTGYVVVAPDYAGLGNEGIQGYGRNDDTGHSVLDASRAAVRLLTEGSLSGEVVLTGHSQGGGSTLSGLALSTSYGGSGPVVAAIPFAPGWQTEELGNLIFQFPGLVPADFTLLMVLYADAANALGEDHATDYFHPDIRADVENAVSTMCVVGLAVWVQSHCPRLDQMADPAMIDACLSCVTGGECTEPAAGFLERSRNNILPIDAGDTPVLLVQGLMDDMATPERSRCIADYMEGQGLTPQICADAEADHMNIVERNVAFVLEWLDAVLAGDAPPHCAGETLPVCE
jgi:dienelactone hydrolase